MLAIYNYIAEDSPSHAARFVDLLEEKCGMIAESPGIGRRRPRLGKGVRSLPFGDYIIFYNAIANGVEIRLILHAKRGITGFLLRD